MEIGDNCSQNYEGREVNCVVTMINENSFNVAIIGLGIEMVNIPNEKYTPVHCMPDNISSKKDHEQYLKDIGYEKYVKDLEDFKEKMIGLYATKKDIGDLLYLFWQRTSDACPLEASEAEKQEKDFKDWVKSISWKIS
jgi:hypothetical protein